eukprot:jgi/Chrzof1/3195/Cz12g15130.t1
MLDCGIMSLPVLNAGPVRVLLYSLPVEGHSVCVVVCVLICIWHFGICDRCAVRHYQVDSLLYIVRVEPEIFRLNGVYRLIYYYCGSSSDCGGVVAMEFS